MNITCPDCQASVSFPSDALPSEVSCWACGRNVAPAVTTGLSVGDYRLKRALGTGGMARVFLAEEVSLRRDVALKVLHQQHLGDEDRVQEFLKEAQTAAQLNHPSIVQIYSRGQSNGLYYFAMELVSGCSARELMVNGPISVDRSLRIATRAAKALHYAWNKSKLVHRDIKPDNIMVRKDGVVKLADFGLARPVHKISESDVIEGSPHYIAPEAITGEPIDFRSDVYSLGATLYHMVTGDFPFVGDSAAETIFMHVRDELVAPHKRNAAVPKSVSQLICRMMARKPADRFASYSDLVAEFRRVRQGLFEVKTATKTAARKSRGQKRFRITKTGSKPNTVAARKRSSGFATALALVLALFSSGIALTKSDVHDQAPVGKDAAAAQSASAESQISDVYGG